MSTRPKHKERGHPVGATLAKVCVSARR